MTLQTLPDDGDEPFTTRTENVAWEQPNRSSEELKMYYSTLKNSIKIEGWTFRNNEGNFRKRVHLLD